MERETLTDPVIWPLAACDDEDLARCAGDGYCATDDAGGRAAFVTHGGEQEVDRVTAMAVVCVLGLGQGVGCRVGGKSSGLRASSVRRGNSRSGGWMARLCLAFTVCGPAKGNET